MGNTLLIIASVLYIVNAVAFLCIRNFTDKENLAIVVWAVTFAAALIISIIHWEMVGFSVLILALLISSFIACSIKIEAVNKVIWITFIFCMMLATVHIFPYYSMNEIARVETVRHDVCIVTDTREYDYIIGTKTGDVEEKYCYEFISKEENGTFMLYSIPVADSVWYKTDMSELPYILEVQTYCKTKNTLTGAPADEVKLENKRYEVHASEEYIPAEYIKKE